MPITSGSAGGTATIGTSYTLAARLDVSNARAYAFQIINNHGSNHVSGVQIRESLDGSTYSDFDIGGGYAYDGSDEARGNFSIAMAAGGEDGANLQIENGESGVVTVRDNVAKSVQLYLKADNTSTGVTVFSRTIPWDPAI